MVDCFFCFALNPPVSLQPESGFLPPLPWSRGSEANIDPRVVFQRMGSHTFCGSISAVVQS